MSQNTQKPGDPAIVVLKNVRLSFPHIFKPRQPDSKDGGSNKPRYSATFLLNKEADKEQIKNVLRAIKHVASTQEKWKNKSVVADSRTLTGDGTTNKLILKGICLRDGAEKADVDGYGDAVMFVSASRGIEDSNGNPQPPLPVVDRNNKPIDPQSGKVYGGCRVHASIRVWAQDNEFGKRINCELRAVAFAGDDEPFGNGPVDTKSEFGDLLDDEFGDDAPAPKNAAAKKPALDDLDDI